MKKYPYFRVTAYCYYISDLLEWFDHFKTMKIPCCIAGTPAKNHGKDCPHYALWRFGKEAGEDETKTNIEPLRGKIVKSYSTREFTWATKGGKNDTENSEMDT